MSKEELCDVFSALGMGLEPNEIDEFISAVKEGNGSIGIPEDQLDAVSSGVSAGALLAACWKAAKSLPIGKMVTVSLYSYLN